MKSYAELLYKCRRNFISLHCLLEITYKCNLRCQHCYIVKREGKEFSKFDILDILRQLKNANCLFLTISGGEPFVREDLFDILDYSKTLNFFVRIFTNGSLITESVARKLKKYKVSGIEISLYGFETTHDTITRVKGSYKKTIEGIRYLTEFQVPVIVKTVLLKYNADEFWEFREFLKRKKINLRGVGAGLLISPRDDGDKYPLTLRPTDEQLRNYIKLELKSVVSRAKKSFPRKIEPTFHLCRAGISTCNVTPYGDVNPCVQLRVGENRLGKNYFSFLELWNNHPEFLSLRNLYTKHREKCMKCDLLLYCITCPGIAKLETDSYTSPLPEVCRQARIRKELYEEIYKKRDFICKGS